VIWPDFTRLPTAQSPFIRFQEIELGQVLQLGDKLIEVLPAVHTVPAVGYAVMTQQACWVFTGDTGRNPDFWKRINCMDVSMLVIETAFSSRESQLADTSLHLSPAVLASELDCISADRKFPIYITHTKPAETEMIMSEIRKLELSRSGDANGTHDIRWLKAGQEFDL
jgi:ribonuclease BN (tRNA processing enzyme)